jgi:hypothetical protein
MALIDHGGSAVAGARYIQWSAIIAGAVVAAGLAMVLHAFAGAIGLAVSSTAPTWRDASFALWLLSGLYLIIVALLTYGLGGYIAGRLRSSYPGATGDELEVRDGAHGLLTWAIATLLTGLMLAFAAPAVDRLVAPTGGETGPAASVAGESLFAYDLDRLFRSDPPLDGADIEFNRTEAGRILLAAAGHSGLSAEDRDHLLRLVSVRTGLSAEDAATRVDGVIAAARENVARGRRATVMLAFMSGTAALLGLAAAWFAAISGAEHRDRSAPSLWWPASGRRRVMN